MNLKSIEQPALILTHHNADIDAISSALALQYLLKQLKIQSSVGVAESVSKPAQNLTKNYEVLIDPDCKNYKTVILVDTSSSIQLQSVKNLRADFVIDHHPESDLAKGAQKIINQNAKSTAQLIFALFKEENVPLREAAVWLASGIVADTAHLKLAELEEFKIMAELLEFVSYKDIQELIETPQDESEAIASLKAASRMQIYKFKDLIVVFSYVKSHEAPSARALIKLGADIAVVMAKRKDELRISSRAKPFIKEKNLDLSVIFQKVGKFIDGSGGGHDLAGSANGKAKPIDKLTNFILKEISQKIKQSWKKVE